MAPSKPYNFCRKRFSLKCLVFERKGVYGWSRTPCITVTCYVTVILLSGKLHLVSDHTTKDASRHTYTPRVSLLVQRMRRGARRRWWRALVKRVVRWQSRPGRQSFRGRHRMTLPVLRSTDDPVTRVLIDALLQVAIRINRAVLRTDEVSVLLGVRPRLLVVRVSSAE